MGAYLNKPITEKETESGGDDFLKYGATCMQGWRINQEDAHNCILGIHPGWNMFAVYDGHGGSEVAQYTAQHFPEFLKSKEFWQAEDISDLLQKGFVDFDDLIRSETVLKELTKMANEHRECPPRDGNDSEDEAERIKTIEESGMPIEELLARYGYVMTKEGTTISAAFEQFQRESNEVTEIVEKDVTVNSGTDEEKKEKKRPCDSGEAILENEAKRAKTEQNGQEKAEEEIKTETEAAGDNCPPKENGEAKEAEKEGDAEKKVKEESVKTEETAEKEGAETVKNEETAEKEGKEETVDKEESAEKKADETTEKPVEGEEGQKPVAVVSPSKIRSKVKKTLPSEGPNTNGAIELAADLSEEDSSFTDSSMEEEEEVSSDEGEDEMSTFPGEEKAGEDSGTTACVVLINREKVIVANAGDSRAVLCRDGKAIDLSVDHKPEDEEEKRRIERAGGIVNEDGRVNGGLNLSRALGDHTYKKVEELPLAEQMISALPDVKIEALQKEDEFLVVACDGIWNSMESQEVVDFVKTRLVEGKACEKIAEEMCEHCLAENTHGDGTGCDNMTVIVAQILH